MPDPDRPELVELRARIEATLDSSRPAAVAKRRATGQRTARENIADLVDEDSFFQGRLLSATEMEFCNQTIAINERFAFCFVLKKQ